VSKNNSIEYGLDRLESDPVICAGAESSTANNADQAVIRYIPGLVDLAFDRVTTTQKLIRGELAKLESSVINTGNTASGEITVVAALPAGTRLVETWSPDWDCAFGDGVANGQAGWRCTHAPLLPGQISEPVIFTTELGDVQPGDTLTLTATASTAMTETNPDNNRARDSVTVEPWATVRGTVWLDSNFNGTRDAGENGISGIHIDPVSLQAQSDGGGQSAWGTMNADGTYEAYVRPGTYRVDLTAWYPYEFIDSVDSDLIYHEHVLGSSSAYGYTDWFTTATGVETVLDAGVRSYS
jgi:hypothetical protein